MESLEKPSNEGDELLEIVSRIKDHKEVFEFYKEAQMLLISLNASTVEAKLTLANMLEDEDDGFDPEDYAGYCAFKKNLTDVIENNKQSRRQLAYRFKELSEGILRAPSKVEDIDYQFDKIADDESVKSFKHYYKLFCMYRYEFGKLAKGIEPYLLSAYKDEFETLRAYEAVNQSMKNDEPITFTFKLYRHRPYEQGLRDLKTFQSNVKACMDVFYHMYKCVDGAGIMYPDVLRDSSGRMVDRERPSQLFERWERCLLAYGMKRSNELKLADIAKQSAGAVRIRNKSKTPRTFNNEVDAASAAKKDIAEAERLIASTAKGTFPY